MIELERLYLAKSLPKDLADHPAKEVIDIFVPQESDHPTLRIRKNGEKCSIEKKYVPENGDRSQLIEETIVLSKEEFEALASVIGKRLHKTRYFYPFQGRVLEVAIHHGALAGLVTVDAEFSSVEEKDAFMMPAFCLAEVTYEEHLRGGYLAGRGLADIKDVLDKYGYKPL